MKKIIFRDVQADVIESLDKIPGDGIIGFLTSENDRALYFYFRDCGMLLYQDGELSDISSTPASSVASRFPGLTYKFYFSGDEYSKAMNWLETGEVES